MGAAPVQVQMRNVALHLDEQAIVNVRALRGELISRKADEPPVFDDKTSFHVRIDHAEIALDTASLSRLLNVYVFRYAGSPLRHLDVETAGEALKVTGTMDKAVPFTIVADAHVDPNGDLRLHPRSIKALGIPATRILSAFGVSLEKLVHVEADRGVRIEGDDFVLTPAKLLPPPRIEGRLQAVRVEPGRIVQIFGPGRAAPLHPPVARTNYMYYRGGVLRFGKLTMTDVDLELIDEHPQDPFDFYQDRYNDQLVAGYSKNTREHGLEVFMPDYRRLAKRSAGSGGSRISFQQPRADGSPLPRPRP